MKNFNVISGRKNMLEMGAKSLSAAKLILFAAMSGGALVYLISLAADSLLVMIIYSHQDKDVVLENIISFSPVSEVVARAKGILFLITASSWLAFIYIAAKIFKRSGHSRIEFTPIGAVGWHLVPILNMLKPFQIICEILSPVDPLREDDIKAGDHPSRRSIDLSMGKSPDLATSLWWISMVTGVLFYFGAQNYESKASGLEQVAVAARFWVLTDLIIIVAMMSTIRTAGKICRRLEELSGESHQPAG